MMKNNNLLVLIGFSLLLLGGCISSNADIHTKGLADIQTKGLNLVSTDIDNALFSKGIHNRKQALVVGVSDYAGEANDLDGIELDVEKMKNLFESWGFEVTTLYDQESLKIIDKLTQYGKELTQNDDFAFYYSGHGSHKKDTSNDEADGEDETLVLSDGSENIHLLDDTLYGAFNAIKSKKMIFFDSCHSGTVFRSLSGKFQSKTITPTVVGKTFSKSLTTESKNDAIDTNSDFIVFSSAQDNEEALATPEGSLFTNSIYNLFANNKAINEPFSSIKKNLTNEILKYAKKTGAKAHHPSISYSKSYSDASSLKDFTTPKSNPIVVQTPIVKVQSSQDNLDEKTLQQTLESFIQKNKIERMKLKYKKSTYSVGDSINFTLDTEGEKGYLTIFYVDKNDVTLLYPNPFVSPKIIEGSYAFPKDFSGGKFELEAYKSCNNCKEEKTTIYTLLSARPILDSSVFQSKDGLFSFAKESSTSQTVTRSVRLKATTKSTNNHPELGKYEFIVQ